MGLLSSSPSYTPQIKQDIDKSIASGPIVVFSASYCAYCRRVKEILKPWQPFTIVEVDQMGGDAVMAEYKAYLSEVTGASRITWPRVFIGGKCVGGCDDTTNLQQNGQLEKLINAAKESTDSSKL
eukprot:186607_1